MFILTLQTADAAIFFNADCAAAVWVIATVSVMVATTAAMTAVSKICAACSQANTLNT